MVWESSWVFSLLILGFLVALSASALTFNSPRAAAITALIALISAVLALALEEMGLPNAGGRTKKGHYKTGRQVLEDWEKAGQRDVLHRAHEKCDRILAKCEEMVLPGEVDHEIEAYFKAL